MPDELAAELEAAVDAETGPRQPDLAWVMQRGGRVRRLRRARMSAGVVAVIAIGSVGIQALEGDNEPTPPPVASVSTPDVQEPLPGEVVEDTPEAFQAQVFAIRALDAVGLMTLDGRGFLINEQEEVVETDDGWRVPFSATECDPSTCRPLSGERDPESGNALSDTFVFVSLEDGRWEVIGTEGNMSREDHEALLGFWLPDVREPSHWEAHGVVARSSDEGVSFQILPVWVGPFPTTAPGSVCSATPLDGSGEVLGEPTTFFQEAPTSESDRAGGVHSRPLLTGPESTQDVAVKCRQFTGPGWEIASEAEEVTMGGDIVGLSADLVWRGERGFTSAAVCHATLLDEDQEIAFEGSGRADPLWRPSELKEYPYRATVTIDFGGKGFFGVENYYVDRFDCVSR